MTIITDKIYPSFDGDMWAAGICLYRILTNKHPWEYAIEDDQNFSNYLQLKIFPVDIDLAKFPTNYLPMILEVNPYARATASFLNNRLIYI